MGQWQQGAPRAASALTCRHSRSLLSTVHGQVGGGCVRVSGAHRSTPAPRLCMGRVCESQSTANRHATRKQYCPALCLARLPGSAAWRSARRHGGLETRFKTPIDVASVACIQ